MTVAACLWPASPPLVERAMTPLAEEFGKEYGVDYVNLGYKSGNEGVIKVVVTDFRELYTTE